jgi:hypothetical protein
VLGVAYNVFDGEELLGGSIKTIRRFADYVVVIAQEVSNFGKTNNNLREQLSKLKNEGLIDQIHWYEPEFEYNEDGSIKISNGIENEQKKRQIGLDLCKVYGCRVFSSMDADEFYDDAQYEYALKDFIDGGYNSSFCQMQTYYKKPTWKLSPPETYHVPLFYKIGCDTKFTFEFIPPYPVTIDPSRRIKAGYSRIFERNEIEMHHFSYLREDIESKIRNSSAQFSREEQDKVIEHYNNISKIEEGALFLNNQTFDLIEVENKFNIIA